MGRLTSVPSLVSIINLGPVSSAVSGGGFGGFAGDETPRLALLRAAGFDAGSASVVSLASVVSAPFATVVSVGFVDDGVVVARLPVGRRERERAVLGGLGFGAFTFAGCSFVASGDGDSSGVGSGVGATATSVTGRTGSSMRAPTEVTRLVFFPEALVAGAAEEGASLSAISGPPITGSKDPPNRT